MEWGALTCHLLELMRSGQQRPKSEVSARAKAVVQNLNLIKLKRRKGHLSWKDDGIQSPDQGSPGAMAICHVVVAEKDEGESKRGASHCFFRIEWAYVHSRAIVHQNEGYTIVIAVHRHTKSLGLRRQGSSSEEPSFAVTGFFESIFRKEKRASCEARNVISTEFPAMMGL
ncbi:hypothetical protein IFM89_026750 [Coptis chinensis]|uniref:Uncharacterized protein n=1 Tax=Coptis chinensis TaxID=261450 RepID=A0A835M498_9MAGN|nr:hypothetical protein IFM89_026750 [Coptis chinensis]